MRAKRPSKAFLITYRTSELQWATLCPSKTSGNRMSPMATRTILWLFQRLCSSISVRILWAGRNEISRNLQRNQSLRIVGYLSFLATIQVYRNGSKELSTPKAGNCFPFIHCTYRLGFTFWVKFNDNYLITIAICTFLFAAIDSDTYMKKKIRPRRPLC